MTKVRQIKVLGDSILKGVQLDAESQRYRVDNHIDIPMLSTRFSLEIDNLAKFGCTVVKGEPILDYALKEDGIRAVVMDFGGNDCDHNWAQVAAAPDADHLPNTPMEQFLLTYTRMVERVKARGIRPIIATLPPIDPQRFLDWFCRDLDKAAVLRWLGSVNTIYRFQEYYSRASETVARATGADVVDLRGAFLAEHRVERLLCEDGIHPNTAGQRVITAEFARFAAAYT